MTENPTALPKVSERYDIKDAPIGRGGMGVVYKAYDSKTRRFVALKTISGEVDPAALELFEREWNVLARISHPNIVDILDTGDYAEDGHRKPYFVMPLLPGVTLEQLIKTSSQRLTVERTIEVICQVCRGLQAAHEQGLVHRDIKPSNIFVMEDDTVKIIDFGVVHLADTRTITGMKGTPHYMAPEQIDGKAATALSDIFSLGVVSYEALTGRKPFARRNESEMFEAIRTHIPAPASEINPGLNHLISRTVHKAIAKQPWHRFSTAREFSDTLQKALRNEPIERFDRAKIQPRIDRVKRAHAEGDYQFATEILTELESEGHIDPEMSMLRLQLDQAVRTKTIRQLLESARTRMEEDEYPLALQKIQDVLNLDPTNVDANALRRQIERQRSEKQTENWLRLATEHLDNQDYPQAHQAIEEILKINSADTRARELLVRVERSEQEQAKAREEKQRLYEAAVNSYRNGEISTALNKLERLLELNRSGPKTAPTNDAQYQGLYNQIRSEREAARNAYAEGRKYLADKNFAKALEICEHHLQKQAGDPLFQALKLETEEVQRQDHSAAIAEFGRRLDSEPDLDKKYSIISEAVQKYPAESQFQSSLKLIKDRRDLVNSIVARARQYEERGQFNDAAAQWDILRNIHPSYPGLDIEVQRLARRREDQVKQDAKTHWVERIDRHFGAGEYAKARELVKQALVEFPADEELQGLDSLADQALKRSDESNGLLKQGQELIAENRFDEGIEILRKAQRLDERNPSARAALLGALLQRARDLMITDWHGAEPLVKEVLELEPSDPVARSLTSLIGDYKRQEAVSRILVEARTLQAGADMDAALAAVEQGLRTFPNESRLVQLHHTLRGAVTEGRKQQQTPTSWATPAALVATAAAGAGAIETVTMPAAADPAKLPAIPPPPSTPIAPPPKVPAAPVSAADKNRNMLLIWAAVAAVVVIVFGAFVNNLRSKTATPVPHTRNTRATTNPNTSPKVPVDLTPTLPELRINSDLASGKLVFDQTAPADLQQGSLTKDDIEAGSHHVSILDSKTSKKPVFDFDFNVKPKQVSTLSSAPTGTVPGLVITSLGPDAIVYATPNLKGGIEGQPLQPIPADGAKLTLPAQGQVHYLVDDGKGKPRQLAIDFSTAPAVYVSLSGAVERVAITVSANVPDAMVLLNGHDWKPLVKGSRTVWLTAGKYKLSLRADDYQPVDEQAVEIKSGQTTPQTLTFALNPVAHLATLVVQGAPADTEVVVDGNTLGTVAGGNLKKDLSAANHTVVLRKPNYVDYKEYHQFVAGQTITVSGADMKPFGKLSVKVFPENAHVVYRHSGSEQDIAVDNNQEVSLPPGDYTLKASAEGYLPDTESLTIAPGKDEPFTTTLTKAVAARKTVTPSNIFENAKSWTFTDADSWWTHSDKGFSFVRQGDGTLAFTLLRDPKSFLKERVKKYEFVADYRDEDNKIVYTIDQHHLSRKVVVDGKELKEGRSESPITAGDFYHLVVQINPDSINVKVNGATDTAKRPEQHGKFGFVNEVVLAPR